MTSVRYFPTLTSVLLILSTLPDTSLATTRKLATLYQHQPLVLNYHNGPLLKGTVTVNLIWYGNFSPIQTSIIADFVQAMNSGNVPPPPSVASWWQTTENYKGESSNIVLGAQILDENCSLGKSLTTSQIVNLASKAPAKDSINVVLTAADVLVDGFCTSNCGTHGSGLTNPKDAQSKFAYAWVGNSVSQCPGQCAWPFHQPIYGPQTQPLEAPNGDVGVDGMVINLATVLPGTVTDPFDSGYFQGPAIAPLEAVTACPGIFGSGAYLGYTGFVLTDKATSSSYNAQGVKGRKYLLPAMPISGASMNPARSIGPAFVCGVYKNVWVFVLGPILGATTTTLTYSVLRVPDVEKTKESIKIKDNPYLDTDLYFDVTELYREKERKRQEEEEEEEIRGKSREILGFLRIEVYLEVRVDTWTEVAKSRVP
ncbi:hypothetical protein Vadar_014942 [Vaccinium darrowii]|uniref:Uncharacterized protein n=1 Tax=Vaccinium darrowii TaxID=229202 RepID=A0ACB7XZ75_9ERIC|nr:hypothetical protein Vadar_014942 [Vaccinium darrowii]